VAVLSNQVWLFAKECVQFAFLIPPQQLVPDTFGPDWNSWVSTNSDFTPLRILFFLFSLGLLCLGLRQLKRPYEELFKTKRWPAPGAYGAAAVVATLMIVTHVIVARRSVVPNASLRYTEAMAGLPVVLALVAGAVHRWWKRLAARAKPLSGWLAGTQALPPMMAAVPFVLLSVFSLWRPLFDQRGLLFVAPYVLLLISLGLMAILRRYRVGGVCLLLVLAGLHMFSLKAYSNRHMDPVDHRELAEALKARLQTGDVIFLHRGFDTTPLLYYLPAPRYRVVGRRFDDPKWHTADGRIWVVIYGKDVPPEIKPALEGYRRVETVSVHLARVELYCPPPTPRHDALPVPPARTAVSRGGEALR
jgi:hypothetical protein